MAVAQLRGVTFMRSPIESLHSGHWVPNATLGYNVDDAHKALRDVYQWLNYGDVGEYLDGMVELGSSIFGRAKY